MAERVAFRGRLTCSCVATSLPLVEQEMLLRGLISNSIDIYQLGYSGSVSASAGTHNRGGCTDVGQFTDDHIELWRRWGWTMQHRTRAQGFDPHGHGWPKGCDHLSPAAQAQASAWQRGRNGLVSNGYITGPGPKGSDTPTWREALRERKPILMALKDDIAAEVIQRLRGEYKDIADAVLARDVVPNTVTGNAKNKTVSTATALSYLGKNDDNLSAKLDQVIALLTPKETP